MKPQPNSLRFAAPTAVRWRFRRCAGLRAAVCGLMLLGCRQAPIESAAPDSPATAPDSPAATPATAPAAPPPNILLYMIDTLRADELGCYGAAVTTTPHFDRFAAAGTLFESASAVAPATRPSIASVMTGVPPWVHGAENVQNPLGEASASLPRLAELLRARGYFTAGIVANPNVSSVFGFDKGFEVYRELFETRPDGTPPGPHDLRSDAEKVVGEVKQLLETVPRDRPFFLFVLSIDPHAPYGSPPPFNRQYDPAADKAAPDRTLARSRAQYRGAISYADDQFGRLIDWLIAGDQLDQTLVVVTADHGEEFGEHGETGHGKQVYEESTHVPLILHGPGFPAARRADPVDLLDLSATLVAVGGGAAPPFWLGRDLRGALAPRPIFSTHRSTAGAVQVAVRDQGYKLIEHEPGGKRAYYSLRDDPGERRPLAGAALVAAERALAGRIEEYRKLTGALREQMVKGELELNTADLPPGVLESLRSLGYIE